MKNQLFLRGFAVFSVLLLVQCVMARPNTGMKRISDQRLAELITRLALEQFKGYIITVPLAFGKYDVLKIGKKRRSRTPLLDVLRNQSLEDVGSPLEPEALYRQKRSTNKNAQK